MSPQHNCYSSANGQGNSYCNIEPRLLAVSVTSMHSIDPKFSIAALVSGEVDMANCMARPNAAASYGHNMNSESNEDDYMNYCSDDSELSVGNETGDAALDRMVGSAGLLKRSTNHQRQDGASAALDQLYYQSKLPDLIRPSLARQEDYLRRSHLYTGEILKHHLNFMSVTKGLSVSPKITDHSSGHSIKSMSSGHVHSNAASGPLKIGLSRLQVYASDVDLDPKWRVIDDRCSQSPTSFREIHSHLNAISQITSALGHDTSGARIQMTSPHNVANSRENSESPLSANASTIHNVLHNNFNDSNLKFSIDNILKPSFGRRITDPLHKLSNKAMRKFDLQQRDCSERVERISALDDAMLQNTV